MVPAVMPLPRGPAATCDASAGRHSDHRGTQTRREDRSLELDDQHVRIGRADVLANMRLSLAPRDLPGPDVADDLPTVSQHELSLERAERTKHEVGMMMGRRSLTR